MKLFRAGLLTALLGSSAFGCGGIAHDVAKSTTPGVIEGGIDGISDPANQRKLVDGIDQKLVEDATNRMASGIVDGTLDVFSQPERIERIQNFASAALEPVVRTMDGAVAGMIDTTFAHVFSDATQLKVRLMVRTIVGDVVTQVIQSVKDEMGTKEERDAAIASTVRIVTREAALGFQDAIDRNTREKEKGQLDKHEGNVLSALNKAAESGTSIVWIAGGVVAALVVALIITLVVMMRRRRLHQTEVAERDASLVLLAQAIKSTEDKPWGGEFRETLKETMRDAEGADYLRKLIRDKKDLRLGRQVAAAKQAAAEGVIPPGFDGRPPANGTGVHHS